MKNFVLILLILLFSTILMAQEQANYWFFGEYCGLSFTGGFPHTLTNGSLTVMEGCSAISTEKSNLLFYTDGSTVWNRNHEIMPNGIGLMGNSSSTQSSIIIPWPGHDDKYFVITIDDVDAGGGANGLRYSLIDMTLGDSLGDIVASEKNILLSAPMCEKLTAAKHNNGIDIWVISQKWSSNNFYAYLVTDDGISLSPVISSAGAVIDGNIDNAKGYVKVSPNGEKIAKANAGLQTVEIFDFDNTTGEVSWIVTDDTLGGEAYGIEFSLNSQLLYVNTWKSKPSKKLFQYNLQAGTPQEIIDSRIQIASGTNGALQIAPDNKIYVATSLNSYLSVINAPNKQGTDCDFVANAVYLGGRSSRWGLPNFIQSIFSFNAGFYNETPCDMEPTQFWENSSVIPDSVWWDFGDLSSGDDNYSTEFDPVHVYTGTGLYYIKHKIWADGRTDSITKGIWANEKPLIKLGADTSFCEGDTLVLDAGDDYNTFLWNTGDTTRTIAVFLSGDYWCEVTSDLGCTGRDTINISWYPNPMANAGIDKTIYYGQSTLLDGSATEGLSPYVFEWQPTNMLLDNNIPNPETVPILTPVIFTLTVTDDRNCISEPDYVLVQPEVSVLSAMLTAYPDTICLGDATSITASASGGGLEYNYAWTSEPPGFSSSDSSFVVTPFISGNIIFHLHLTDQINNQFDSSLTVVVNPLPIIDLVPDGFIPFGDPDTIMVCVNDTLILDAGQDDNPEGTSYFWEQTNYPGRYFVAISNDSLFDFQTHTVRVKYPGTFGCESMGEISIAFDLNECQIGVEENQVGDQLFQIFPNPNNGSFTLMLNNPMRNIRIIVFDYLGQPVYTETLEGTFEKGYQKQFHLNVKRKGIYFVQLLSESSTLSVQKMLVK